MFETGCGPRMLVFLKSCCFRRYLVPASAVIVNTSKTVLPSGREVTIEMTEIKKGSKYDRCPYCTTP